MKTVYSYEGYYPTFQHCISVYDERLRIIEIQYYRTSVEAIERVINAVSGAGYDKS